jgi:hypothetical protein
MILYGASVRAGGRIAEANNLDIAPTLLTLMGLPVPEEIKGRVRKTFENSPKSGESQTEIVKLFLDNP